MKYYKRPSLIDHRNFPFTCSNSSGVTEGFRSLHWHNEMEICYIKSGYGKYLINGNEYTFKQGDLFIINNDEIHVCYDDHDLTMQVILFDPTLIWSGGSNFLDYEYVRPFFETDGHFSNKLLMDDDSIPLITDVLNEIEQEYVCESKGHELMIKALLMKLMTLITRYTVQDTFPGSDSVATERQTISSVANDHIKDVIEYIEHHYTEAITLNDLADIGQMSIPYLSSSFKALSGVSPIDYTIRIRLSAAKKELTHTDHSILSIAQNCGFNSLSNFNHLFKSFVGMSPRDYRKL